VKRQTITSEAKPSMKESSPKEMSANEPAAMPATSAIRPSAPIQTSERQESQRALRAASCHSGGRAACGGREDGELAGAHGVTLACGPSTRSSSSAPDSVSE
jgi:hypothetical protein